MQIRKDVQAVIFDEKAKKVLLVKKLDLKNFSYKWRLLKGGIEKGETEKEALKREILEEVGLKNVQILDKIYSYEFTFKNVKHLVSTYLVKANSNEEIKLQTSEVVDYAWVSKEQALKMLFWENEKEALKLLKLT